MGTELWDKVVPSGLLSVQSWKNQIVFTEMIKMANCSESCQQFPVKGGVARLHVGQLVGKETKRSPMVA
jgi:hypothetical protein